MTYGNGRIQNEMNNASAQRGGRNLGVEILRCFACFSVLINHFNGLKDLPEFVQSAYANFGMFAVPVFVFLSFYFSEKLFLYGDFDQIKKRLIRLLIPYLIFPIIYFIVFDGVIIAFRDEFRLPIKAFFWQYAFGTYRNFNSPLWFLLDLIILSVIYIIVFRIVKIEISITFVCLSFFVALLLQYSGLNYRLFSPLRYEMRWATGRFCEIIPYAATGFLCAHYGVFEKLKKNRMLSLILSGVFCLFFIRFKILPDAPGFGYSYNNCIPLVFFMVCFAYLFPVEKNQRKSLAVIAFITKFTLGIYCMHLLVGRVFDAVLAVYNTIFNRFLFCILVYVFCFLISFIVSKFPLKYIRMLVD